MLTQVDVPYAASPLDGPNSTIQPPMQKFLICALGGIALGCALAFVRARIRNFRDR